MIINILLALVAGFISFLSPCIFPVIPSYISYIGAATYDDGFKKNRGALPLILSFILGFTLIFSIMGVAFSTLGIAFSGISVIITRVSGVIVMLLGLNFIFNFISFLDNEKKIEFRSEKKGVVSSLLLGMAFGAGWSPCIGPILASILFLAGSSGTLLQGVVLLLFFSIGLGIPFLLSGIFIAQFREKTTLIKKNMGKIKIISGVFIFFIGFFIFMNKLSNINIFLNNMANDFSNWYLVNATTYNISVGVLLILLTIWLAVIGIKRFKSKKSIIVNLIFTSIFLLAAIISISGIVNWGVIITGYLKFQGL